MKKSALPRVITIGEATIDMILQSDGSYMPVPGGSSIIVGLALGRQGHNVASLTPVSNDGFGDITRANLEASGVDTSMLITVDEPSTLAMATIDSQGDAQYRFYIEGCSQGTWNIDTAINGPKPGDIISCCGSFSLGIDAMADAFDAMFNKFSKEHVIVFDPNVRGGAIGDNADLARERIERWASQSTIVRASTEDIIWLYPETTIEQVAKRFLENGAKLVSISDGSYGAYAYTKENIAFRLSHKVEKSLTSDTVGAGDTLNAGIIIWLMENGHLTQDSIGDLTVGQLEEMLEAGIVLATQTCKEIGAEPPWAELSRGSNGLNRH